ncbi:MAG: AsmA-like C-terminal region-containing protein, partial [Woeseiaceae bacterium]|nr:AsmA-like C-terminal region-containing protein [Woeseiaceae bacterium]
PQNVMKPKLYTWFQEAIVAGRMPTGSTRFQGPLDKFPFDGGEGRMLIEADVRDMIFKYARQFPPAQVSEMHVVLDNTRVYTQSTRSLNQGNTVVDAQVEIADLRNPVLTIDSFSTGTLETIRDFSANSPIGAVFGGQLDRVSVSGDASFSLDLVVPILDWRSFTFTARVATNDGTLAIDGLQAPLTELTGAVTIERDLISSDSLSARFLGEPINIDLVNATPEQADYRVIARASGVATADALVNELGAPLQGFIEGQANYEAQVLFPRAGGETPVPLAIRVRSDLDGLSSSLPWPFGKPADEAQAFFGELTFRDGGARIESRGNVDERYAWQLGFTKVDDAWDIDRGMLMLGSTALEPADVRGLHIRGRASELRLAEWLALSRRDDNRIGMADRIRSVDIVVDDLFVLGQHLEGHAVRVDRSARDWLVQLEGEQVRGSVFVPYDFSSDRALVLDMERLVLPGDETRDPAEAVDRDEIDPRTLPPITVRAAEFGIGKRFFGAVEADIQRTDGGLSADTILARDPTFEIVGNGSWLVDPSDERGFRTRITASLTSNNVEETMRRLNYEPGIVSDDMGMLFDLGWSGGPRVDFFDSLDGDVQVRFGTGQLEEVEPGAGRMIGLMSIVALPRRLSLDFRDFFEKGFGFDKIDGTFRIEDGVAHTCDLRLEGPAANVGVIGRADLASREYQQAAVVAPSVGNTLPIVGGLVAGPQAAVALLLFSQIFKDPLEEVGQVFYSMTGSFDEPVIESANAQAFASSGRLAGCVPVSE